MCFLAPKWWPFIYLCKQVFKSLDKANNHANLSMCVIENQTQDLTQSKQSAMELHAQPLRFYVGLENWPSWFQGLVALA